VVFENNKPFVIDAFREGRFDYIELASDVAETRFFHFLFGQQMVAKLAQLYQELGAFDDEGLFIGDGTYLFVPDNPRYEDSLKLLFDEHNHPVNKQQEQEMTKAQRARCRWRRCYKAVLLLHCDAAGEHFVVVGVRVLKANESEA